MGVRGELFSTKVSLQNRTYFFNVKENRLGDLYLNIVESKNRDEGGFERQSVILFADDLQEFLKGFDESLRVLEKSIREKRRGSKNVSHGEKPSSPPRGKREDSRGFRPSGSGPSRKRDDSRGFRSGERPDSKRGERPSRPQGERSGRPPREQKDFTQRSRAPRHESTEVPIRKKRVVVKKK